MNSPQSNGAVDPQGDSQPAWAAAFGLPKKPSPKPLEARVLVVDDNRSNREVFTRLLKRLGCTTFEACNGAEALMLVQGEPLDLILMDCEMPLVDGYQAATGIRALEREGARVPIVALSAHAEASHKPRCLEAGMDDYLAKPVSIQGLTDCVQKWTQPNSISAEQRGEQPTPGRPGPSR